LSARKSCNAALFAALFLVPGASFAQLAGDTLDLPTVVTTAGRSRTTLKHSPVGVSIVGEREMRDNGAQRLGDVLGEQTGLSILRNQWGAGVQVQGLSPDYTLILVDGEPMVGREGGTLNLDRIMVTGVAQVEILKGPASSLYGSEALGGVINLVTQRPTDPLSGSFHVRYGPEPGSVTTRRPGGTYGDVSVGAGVGVKRGEVEASLLADRMTSRGYDLTPSERGQTAPRYQNYTLQPKAVYAWTEDTRLTASGRFFHEDQRNEANYVLNNTAVPSNERSVLNDGSASATLEHALSPLVSWTLKGHANHYRKTTDLSAAQGDSALSATFFGQRYYKSESFLRVESGRHALVLGGGGAADVVSSDYVAGGEKQAASGFAFAQEDWKPREEFTLQASARFDAHTDYQSHLSPRLAALYRPWSWLGLRASVGNGFKAPTSQELYLDFTNAQVGYTVFGATGAQAGLERLRAQGDIDTSIVLQAPELGALRPENSWSFNLGAEVSVGPDAQAKVNFFRNNVRDLIETAPVAVKTNQQSVYTYFNLNRIHTQGMETEVSCRPARWLSLSAGYQFLIAEDEDVLARIEDGTILKPRSDGTGFRPVQRVEYGGLLNRSRHTANAKMEWNTGKPGFLASLRGIYHGRYGFGDLNANGILDDDREYAPGYLEVNVTATQKLSRFASVQAGVNNLLDRHAPAPAPTLPGRLYYAGVQLQYF
jgi:outer membrane receptor for ferrienterochelin and colicins